MQHIGDEQAEQMYQTLHKTYAPATRDFALSIGGVYIKLGQVMASRRDAIPAVWCSELSDLLDRVPPQPITVRFFSLVHCALCFVILSV